MSFSVPQKLGHWLCILYVAAAGVPIFLLPGYFTTNLTFIFSPEAPASLDSQPLRVHWIVVVAGLVAILVGVKFVLGDRRLRAPVTRLVLLLLVMFLVALTVGLILTPNRLSPVYCVQTLIPIVGFWAGLYLVDGERHLICIAAAFSAATSLAVIGILSLAVYLGVFSTSQQGVRTLAQMIPQIREYYPFVVATSLSLSLACLPLARGVVRAVLLAAILLQVGVCAISWSRMAIVLIGIVLLSPIALEWLAQRPVERRLVQLRVGLFLLALLVFFQSGIFVSRIRSGGLSQSNDQRLRYAIASIQVLAENPVFGRMFIPDWEHDPILDRDFRIPRLVRPHNQYFDYGIRAGIPAVIVLLLIMWRAGQRLWGMLLSSSADLRRQWILGVAAPLLAVAVGNLAHLFLIQAQTGTLVWFLIGISVRLGELFDTES